MADLDDFFAKKDRKKTKSKKFTTSEELAKKLEDTSKKANEVKPRKIEVPTTTSTAVEGEEPVAPVEIEDEWRDFQEEERKDYSGLKIGQLQIADDDSDAEDGYEKYDSEGELTNDPDKQKSSAWNTVSDEQNEATAAAAAVAAAAVTTAQQEKAPVSNIYISPALRNAQLAAAKPRLKKGVLPDIHNQEYFPILGSAKPEEVKKKRPDPGFEEVKHGGRVPRSTELGSTAPVSVGNRFNSLADS